MVVAAQTHVVVDGMMSEKPVLFLGSKKWDHIYLTKLLSNDHLVSFAVTKMNFQIKTPMACNSDQG